jgi:hypothetical protein
MYLQLFHKSFYLSEMIRIKKWCSMSLLLQKNVFCCYLSCHFDTTYLLYLYKNVPNVIEDNSSHIYTPFSVSINGFESFSDWLTPIRSRVTHPRPTCQTLPPHRLHSSAPSGILPSSARIATTTIPVDSCPFELLCRR